MATKIFGKLIGDLAIFESLFRNFPAEQYIVHYQLQKNGKLVNVIFVMIDTLLLCGSSRKDFRRTENSDEKESLRKESLEWLKGMLTFVDENWLVLGGNLDGLNLHKKGNRITFLYLAIIPFM